MVSTPNAVTAAAIGILSSVALLFYGEHTMSLLHQPQHLGPNYSDQQTSEPIPPIHSTPNSCAGVNQITTLEELGRMRWVLVDYKPAAVDHDADDLGKLAKEAWETRSECNVGFVDFVKYPQLASKLRVTSLPSLILVDGLEQHLTGLRSDFVANIDCQLTALVLKHWVPGTYLTHYVSVDESGSDDEFKQIIPLDLFSGVILGDHGLATSADYNNQD
jgi:hypothetical protein